MAGIKLSWAADPVLMMEAANLHPDDWQVKVLRSTSKKIMILCGRQMGKSTVTAVKALHRALCFEDSLILIASKIEDQAVELFDKIKKIYKALGSPIPGDSLKFSLCLDNGSRILALPGDPNNIVGYSAPALVILDEASRVREEMFPAVSPMLAVSNGTLMMLSTPFGRRGFFFREWESGIGYERIRAKASECPRISAKFLESERRSLGERQYLQNYENEFVASDDQVFSKESIDRAFESDMPAIHGF